jgi:PhnB protein
MFPKPSREIDKVALSSRTLHSLIQAMKPVVEPYLFFGGQCEAALNYYHQYLGAEIRMIMRYRESPEPPMCPLPEGWGDKIMHAAFTIGASRLMGSDGMKEAVPEDGHCLSITMPDEAAARRAFAVFADGGKTFMPIGKTFWSACFGMVTDRFGIQWMVTVPEDV